MVGGAVAGCVDDVMGDVEGFVGSNEIIGEEMVARAQERVRRWIGMDESYMYSGR